jgi:RNA polymerase sigma-70 factor (ECF subfamily)
MRAGIPMGLDSRAAGLQAVAMPGDRDSLDAGRALARQAESLRGPLSIYFRRRVNDPAEVDDLVQDVFARIIARTADGPVLHLKGYVFQTAASVLADRARRRATRQAAAHVPFEPDRHAGADIDPARIAEGREDLRRAAAALLTLPDRTRAVFVLHRLEGQGYRQIAAAFGISVSAVEKHMMRAIRRLSGVLRACE